ncbi:MAG: roadblock/LC7 domain-containing protein [Thermodesulfobacteriota bacterium]
MSIVLSEEKADKLDSSLSKLLDESGATYAMLTDMGGNLLSKAGDENFDGAALAVLTAANFAATKEIASLIGEKDFSLLFHRGENENIHFSKVNSDIIMIALFKPYLSLGLLRLKVDSIKEELHEILGE